MSPTAHHPETAPDRFAVLGEALALLAQSDLYGRRSLHAVGDILLPPLSLGQIRFWRREGQLVGLATWAWLDAETEAAVLEGALPEPQTWRSGPHPVVMDFAAPFGGGFAMGRDLLRVVFPGRSVRAVRRDASGRARRIIQLPGQDEHGRTRPCTARAAA